MKNKTILFSLLIFGSTFHTACKKESSAPTPTATPAPTPIPETPTGEKSPYFIKFTEGTKNLELVDKVGINKTMYSYSISGYTEYEYGCGIKIGEFNGKPDYIDYVLHYGELKIIDSNDVDEFTTSVFPLGKKILDDNPSVLQPNYFFTCRENSIDYLSDISKNNYVEITGVKEIGLETFWNGEKKVLQISGTISEVTLYEEKLGSFVKGGKTKVLKNVSFTFKAVSANTKK